jgi:hypothetical protein
LHSVNPDPKLALLTKAATALLGSLRCEASVDVSSANSEPRRYRRGFIFKFNPCQPADLCATLEPDQYTDMIVITAGHRVPR